MLRNFLKQYVDGESMELKRLSANQFMEIWENYDKDGINTLIKNKIKFSSHIRKFRVEQLQSHI